MTYRLAPAAGWPAGAQDVAAAAGWIRANIGAHGGSLGIDEDALGVALARFITRAAG